MTPLLRSVLLFMLVAVLAASAGELVIPPKPAPPPSYATLLQIEKRKGPVSREQMQAIRAKYQAASTQWREDVKAWEASLTPAQQAELARRDAAEREARRKESERAQRLPLPQDDYRWQDAAAKAKLTPATIERLGRDKLAYGPAVKQSFTPYLGGPVFITSDSLLNAFHVLFEDSFRHYELRQTTELRQHLEAVLGATRDELAKGRFGAPPPAVWRQVQLVVGPALVLLGDPTEVVDPDVRADVETQVAKIRAAATMELPAWLAPAEPRFPGVDYRACKPIGFYAAEPKLADYFRAVRWLQIVPFRADRDTELAAMAMLAHGTAQAYRVHAEQYFRSYASLLGPTAQRGLPEAPMDLQFYSGPARTSEQDKLQEIRRWLLRDVMPREAWANLPRNQLPPNAGELLEKVEYRVLPAYRVPDAALFQALADRQLEPEGLAVAAMLGSDFARAHLAPLTPAQVGAAETAIAPAPGEQRQREPSLYDDYFAALRTLFAAPEKDAPAFMRNEAWQAKSTQAALAGWAQFRHTFTLQAQRSEMYFGMFIAPPGFVEPNPEFYSRLAGVVERARSALDVNRDRWDTLASATQKLEALSYKQLRQEPWSAADERFLKGYGEQMGGVMGYAGNSYENPNDDAPRWTEVHHNANTDQLLAVAVGRPRILYVLYPWNGMEILCRGSVMTYYEYHTANRLTDPEWKALLDSPKAPAPPAWLRPYTTE